jgi:hypothetical protein
MCEDELVAVVLLDDGDVGQGGTRFPADAEAPGFQCGDFAIQVFDHQGHPGITARIPPSNTCAQPPLGNCHSATSSIGREATPCNSQLVSAGS